MGKEIIIFFILTNVILVILIAGIIIFIFQYRRRKKLHEKEKALIEAHHKSELLNTQLLIQRQTMQFIGSEIHDSVAQKLTLASIYSQKLEFENKYPEIAERLSRISNILNDSLNELRDLSRTLTDDRLQHSGITDLLKMECERVNDTGACKATIESDFNSEMSATVKSFLLRVMQEFMQNSLKHAECDLITIHLQNRTEGLYVTASDNGKGFDSEQTASRGIGLTNMKRRIHLIGGVHKLHSEMGKGTRLDLFIPSGSLNA
jgi:signal transduction histidine kinase